MSIKDIFYIGLYQDKVKAGQTNDIRARWGRSQYNQGGGNMLPSYVYFANPALQYPTDRLAMLYQKDFFKFLKHARGNTRKKLEFIDPRHADITTETVKEKVEYHIRKEGILVLRLKNEFIDTIPYDTTFSRDVRENYEKYCEPV